MISKLSIAFAAIDSALALSNIGEFALSQASEGTEAALMNQETGCAARGGKQQGGSCSCCEDFDPTTNGCLCYEYYSNYVWFVPTDECGVCRRGTDPVTTDHFQIYEWIAQWNVDGTKQIEAFVEDEGSETYTDNG